MAILSKFNTFVADISNKVHNLSSDQLTIALSDSLPTASNTVLANITQISYTNLGARNVTTTSSTQASGTYKLILADLTVTASGTVAQFRYVVLYNSTASGGPLIGWYDYGAEVNMVNGDSLILDFDNTNGVLQIA